MPTIDFILPDGGMRSCVASEDMSLMEVALGHSIPGIIAECNGSAACAICHVVIEQTAAELDAPDDHEDDMLDFTQAPREPGSRLSCQIRVDSRLEGAVVQIPGA